VRVSDLKPFMRTAFYAQIARSCINCNYQKKHRSRARAIRERERILSGGRGRGRGLKKKKRKNRRIIRINKESSEFRTNCAHNMKLSTRIFF